MREKEGEVKDLIEKAEKEKISPKEVVEILKERKLTERAIMRYEPLGYLAWGVLCFLPAIAEYSGLEILRFFALLPRFEFPVVVVCISLAIFVAAIPLTVSGAYYNISKGECRSEDETIRLLKSGPYRIVRHPSHIAWSIFFVTLPIFLCIYVPFTISSVIGIVEIVSLHYHGSIKEERN